MRLQTLGGKKYSIKGAMPKVTHIFGNLHNFGTFQHYLAIYTLLCPLDKFLDLCYTPSITHRKLRLGKIISGPLQSV